MCQEFEGILVSVRRGLLSDWDEGVRNRHPKFTLFNPAKEKLKVVPEIIVDQITI
jgi:hypothetical protein